MINRTIFKSCLSFLLRTKVITRDNVISGGIVSYFRTILLLGSLVASSGLFSADIVINDLSDYLLLESPVDSNSMGPKNYELIAMDDLQFCRFPNSSYVYNDYKIVKKEPIDDASAIVMIQQAQKLVIFCIAKERQEHEAICGIELAHLMRIQCAYVFKGLPDVNHLQAYLVTQSLVDQCRSTYDHQLAMAKIVTDQLDQAGEDLGLDWSSLAHDLNSDPIVPVPEQKYQITLWFIKAKNYVLQKAVALLMYVLER